MFKANENMQILTIRARSSVPGILGSCIGGPFCVDSIFEVKKCQTLRHKDKTKNNEHFSFFLGESYCSLSSLKTQIVKTIWNSLRLPSLPCPQESPSLASMGSMLRIFPGHLSDQDASSSGGQSLSLARRHRSSATATLGDMGAPTKQIVGNHGKLR